MKKPQLRSVNIEFPKSERNKRWRQIGAAIGIIAGLVGIWQYFFPDLFKKESKQTVEVIVPVDSLHRHVDTVPVSIHPPARVVRSEAMVNSVRQGNKNGKNEANQNIGQNQGVIGGSNNKVENKVHRVDGDNYGINGDVNVSSERQFTDQDKTLLTSSLERLEKANNKKYKVFIINLVNGTPNNLFVSQMKSYLITKGYRFFMGGVVMDNGVQGNSIKLGNNGDAFNLDICLLDPEQPIKY